MKEGVRRVLTIHSDRLSVRIDQLSKSKKLVLVPKTPRFEVQPREAHVSYGDLESGVALFEDRDYQLTIELDESLNDSDLSLVTTDALFLERLHRLSSKHPIWQCPFRFRSYVGDFSFQIMIHGRQALSLSLEVYPTKLDYRDDYRQLLEAVTAYERSLTFRLVAPTTVKHSLWPESDEQRTITEWLAILRWKQNELKAVLKSIAGAPHQELRRESLVRAAALVRRASARAASWLARHPQNLSSSGQPQRLLDERRLATPKNRENRYLIGRVRAWRRRLEQIVKSHGRLGDFHSLVAAFRRFEEHPSFADLRPAPRPRSHILQHRKDYRAFASIDRALQRPVKRVQEGMVPLTLKSLHLLYEYWVLLATHSILTSKLGFRCSSEGPPITETEAGASLESQGRVHYEREDGARAQLVYQGLFKNEESEDDPDTGAALESVGLRSLTGAQHPDGILVLTISQVDYPISLVLDAKYRLGSKGGPRSSDINTMHRYRDALLLKRPEPSELVYGVTKAWFIYPGDPEGLLTEAGGSEKSAKQRFWDSAFHLGVGAIPALPGREHLLEEALRSVVMSAPGALERRRPRTLHAGAVTLEEDALCLRAVVGDGRRLEVHKEQGLYHLPDYSAPEGAEAAQYLFIGARTKGEAGTLIRYPDYLFKATFLGRMERDRFPPGYRQALGPSSLARVPGSYLLFSLRDRIELSGSASLDLAANSEEYFEVSSVREVVNWIWGRV